MPRLALLVALLVLVPALPAAQAGEYAVYSCLTPDGAVVNTEGWHSELSGGPQFSSPDNHCGVVGLVAPISGVHAQSVGAQVSWVYEAPPNTALRSFTAWRSMSTVAGDGYNSSPGTSITWPGKGTTDAHDHCIRSFGCASKGNPIVWNAAGNAVHFNVTGSNRVYFNAFCGGSTGATCASRGASAGSIARVAVQAFRANLADTDAPLVRSASGSLLGSGVVRGTKTVSVSASDAGAGVYGINIEVKKAGQSQFSTVKSAVVDDNDGRCRTVDFDPSTAWEFKYPVPCKASATGDTDFDTTSLPDGQHELRISVLDASGNRSTAYGPANFTVHNASDPTSPPRVTGASGAPRAGDQLTCFPGTFSPAPERLEYRWLLDGRVIDGVTAPTYTVRLTDVGHGIACRVTAFRGLTSTTVTSATLRPAATTTSSNAPSVNTRPPTPSAPVAVTAPGARFTAASKVTRRVRYGRRVTLTGRLVDAHRRGLAGARVEVWRKVRRRGTKQVKVTTVVTDRRGVYRYVVPAGVSRNFRFIHASGTTRITAKVVLLVRAKLGFRARKRHVRPYGTMQLRGRLAGRGLPARGPLIEIQVLDGGAWRTVAVRRLRHGRVRFNYRFKRTAHANFKIRAVMKNQIGFPLLATKSKVVTVRVG